MKLLLLVLIAGALYWRSVMLAEAEAEAAPKVVTMVRREPAAPSGTNKFNVPRQSTTNTVHGSVYTRSGPGM